MNTYEIYNYTAIREASCGFLQRSHYVHKKGMVVPHTLQAIDKARVTQMMK